MEEVLGFEDGELKRLAHLARTPLDIRREHDELAAQVRQLRALLLARGGRQAPAAKTLGERTAELDNVVPVTAGGMVPVINDVAAGYPRDFSDLDYPPSIADEYVRCPDVHDHQAFAARVVGDSMAPQYLEGDIVVFAPNTPADDGDDCFVRFLDGQTAFKRVYQDDPDRVRLQPLNSRHPAETFSRHEVTGVWPAVFRIQQIRR